MMNKGDYITFPMKTKKKMESQNQSEESGNQNVPKNLNSESNMNYLGVSKHKNLGQMVEQ